MIVFIFKHKVFAQCNKSQLCILKVIFKPKGKQFDSQLHVKVSLDKVLIPSALAAGAARPQRISLRGSIKYQLLLLCAR